jgi:hypothetical protein
MRGLVCAIYARAADLFYSCMHVHARARSWCAPSREALSARERAVRILA